jgi:hypothetical protein
MGRLGPKFTAEEARAAVAASRSYSEALRRLGLMGAGGNWRTLRKYVHVWGISTDHFDPAAASREALRRPPVPLDAILVEHSTYHRGHLKDRLYQAGAKQRACELCGQTEIWHGRRMSLILDHINGVGDDHRLENLRIVCPNCAATLDTHCGRQNRLPTQELRCPTCGRGFSARYRGQRYCSRPCGSRHDRRGIPKPNARKVVRPPYAQLIREVHALGYVGVGRRYGVSDNAVRKWLRQYAHVPAASPTTSRGSTIPP